MVFKKDNKSGVGHIPWNKGKHLSEELKEKLSKANKGHKMTDEQKQKLSDSRKGISPWNKGVPMSKITRKKLSKVRKGKYGGKNHPNWKGGLSFEPYSMDWTETLRRSIRERDRYTCKLCGELQSDNAFDVHHIDYSKKNCNPDNLITLCHKCHTITNFKRYYWEEYFKSNIN